MNTTPRDMFTVSRDGIQYSLFKYISLNKGKIGNNNNNDNNQ